MAAQAVDGQRFEGLDALRGIAAVSIVAFHAVGIYARGSAPDAAIRPWVAHLDVGVPVFFLLSGFLLYRPFLRARLSGDELRMAAYAWRRALRIAPAYWVALTVATLVLGTAGVFTVTGVPRYFGFLQAYDADTVAGGLPQAWTLCVEVAFYLLLPVWALAVRRVLGAGTLRCELRALAALATTSIAFKVIVLAFVTGPHVTATDPWLIALPAFADMFALGMGLAVLSVRWQAGAGTPKRLERSAWAWWAAAVVLFAVAARAAGLEHVDPRGFTPVQALTRHALYAAIALCALVPAVLGTGLPGRVLRTGAGRVAGRLSYGIYLYHLMVLSLLGRWDLSSLEGRVHPYVLWFGATLAASALLAEASSRLVERPALSLRGLGGPRRRRRPAARAPAG